MCVTVCVSVLLFCQRETPCIRVFQNMNVCVCIYIHTYICIYTERDLFFRNWFIRQGELASPNSAGESCHCNLESNDSLEVELLPSQATLQYFLLRPSTD